MQRGHAAVWGLGLVALIGAFQWTAAHRAAPAWATLAILAAAWTLAAALAGLHRPAGADAGIEAMTVPLALASLGLARGTLVVALGAFLGSLAFDARARNWRPSLAAGRAGRVALAALAGGALWVLLEGEARTSTLTRMGIAAAAGVAYLAVTFGASWAFAALAEKDQHGEPWTRAKSWRAAALAAARPAALEGTAGCLGVVLAASMVGTVGMIGSIGSTGTPPTAGPLSWGFVVIAALAVAGAWAEAGRQAHREAIWHARALTASRAAIGDPVTGLDRGQALRSRLELEIDRSRRDGLPLTLALFDLDGLRRSNAERGVAAGDERLRLLAIRVGVRGDGAYAARWHGGSVGWILPRTAGREALAMAEIVRREAELDANPASCGLVAIPEVAARDADDLLAMADAALGIAKRLGRSRALLDLGGGRFLDGEGRSVDTSLDEDADPSRQPHTPTFFA